MGIAAREAAGADTMKRAFITGITGQGRFLPGGISPVEVAWDAYKVSDE